MKAVIVDDEKHCSATLKYEIERNIPELEVVEIFQNPEEALQAIPTMEIDLLFLDIEMPHLNGFELLQKLGKVNFGVIFTTAYDEFALRAFRHSAVDYLLKPVSSDDVKQAVDKYKAAGQGSVSEMQLQILFNRLEGKGFTKIALPSSEGLDFVNPESIMHCESQSNYTKVFFKDRKRILVSRTLKEIEEMLDGNGFFRVHHSHIVNLNYISKYVKGSGGYLVMDDETQIPVSRSRKESLMLLFQG